MHLCIKTKILFLTTARSWGALVCDPVKHYHTGELTTDEEGMEMIYIEEMISIRSSPATERIKQLSMETLTTTGWDMASQRHRRYRDRIATHR